MSKEQREAVQQKESTAKLQMGSSKNFNSKLYIQHKLKQLLHGMKVGKAAKEQLEWLAGYDIPPL